jgi:hypothetical protein
MKAGEDKSPPELNPMPESESVRNQLATKMLAGNQFDSYVC